MKERVRGLPEQVGAAGLEGPSSIWRKQKNVCGSGGRKIAFSGQRDIDFQFETRVASERSHC